MMKKVCYILLCVFLSLDAMSQLFPQQSLYFSNPLPINAGVAGKDDALSVNLSHRTMWRGVDGAPKTQYISIHTPLKHDAFSVGIQFINDQLGVTRRNGIYATGAYRLHLNKNYRISFGLTGGIQSFTNKWSEIVTTDQGDQVFAAPDQSFWIPQVGAGVYLHGKTAFAGISVPGLLTETYIGGGKYKAIHQISNYSTHIMAGYRFIFNNQWYLSPSALLKYHPSSAVQTDLTCLFGKENLAELGFTYRLNQSMVAIAQVELNDQLKIGYGFDYLMGGLSQYQNGTHEFMLSYKFQYLNKAPNPRLF